MMIRSLMAPTTGLDLRSGPGRENRSYVARRTMVFKPKASQPIYKCTWKGCGVIYASCSEITAHVRNAHLGPRKPEEDSDEEDFFFTEIEDESDSGSGHQQHSSNHHHSHHQQSNNHHNSNSSSSSNAGASAQRHPPSPPTLSHRDMARPPHEDPEYQRQIVGNYRQGLLSMTAAVQQQQQQHLVHQQQQQQQHQHHQQQQQIHQLNAAIKPPLPATAGAAAGQQFHQSLNNNNNNNSAGSGMGSNGSSNGSASIHTSPQIHHNYAWSQVSPTSPQKHVRLSPRPSASYPYPSPNYQIAQQQQQQHHYQQAQHLGQIQLSPGAGAATVSTYHTQSSSSSSSIISSSSSSSSGSSLNGGFVAPGTSPGANRSPLSPNRRTRGENKKCRKVYGMDHKEQWCTQCKWKKACSRFGD